MICCLFFCNDRGGKIGFFFFSSRRRHTRWPRDWSSDVCSSDLFPVFAIPKPGSYRLQPIFVEEVAELAVNAAYNVHNKIIDTAGPDILTFEEMVRLIARKIRSRSLIFTLSPGISLFLMKILNTMVNDTVLTSDELGALMANLLVSKNPPTGKTRMSEWLDRNADS